VRKNSQAPCSQIVRVYGSHRSTGPSLAFTDRVTQFQDATSPRERVTRSCSGSWKRCKRTRTGQKLEVRFDAEVAAIDLTNGRATGVLSRSRAGHEIRVEAERVIIASGGQVPASPVNNEVTASRTKRALSLWVRKGRAADEVNCSHSNVPRFNGLKGLSRQWK
jgi:hypothetical protein